MCFSWPIARVCFCVFRVKKEPDPVRTRLQSLSIPWPITSGVTGGLLPIRYRTIKDPSKDERTPCKELASVLRTNLPTRTNARIATQRPRLPGGRPCAPARIPARAEAIHRASLHRARHLHHVSASSLRGIRRRVASRLCHLERCTRQRANFFTNPLISQAPGSRVGSFFVGAPALSARCLPRHLTPSLNSEGLFQSQTRCRHGFNQ
jgi:hypothetical protein